MDSYVSTGDINPGGTKVMKYASCILLVLFLFVSGIPVSAQDEIDDVDDVGICEDEGIEEIDLTDEELDALLTRVDRFFIDQDMAQVNVDVDVYRDPSGRLNERNIREGDPSRIAGLSTIVSHYAYEHPGFYELKIMGEALAGSDLPPNSTFFSQLIPLPGAPIYTETIRERFLIRFDGTEEVNGVQAYRIRYSAIDRDTEFFNWIVYFIDIEREVILRVESTFDNTWYVGSGEGNFYYEEIDGKYLPLYGNGDVFFQPNRHFTIWGKWYMWDYLTPEEVEAQNEEPETVTDDQAEALSDGETAGDNG